jgi:transposase
MGHRLTQRRIPAHTRQQDFTEFLQALTTARVVMEVGTHSAWVPEVIAGCGHEMLVANPRLMDGSKRRKRKSDRIDATGWPGWGAWIRSRCTRFSTAVGRCARTW